MGTVRPPSKKFLRNAAIASGILAVIITIQTNWFRSLIKGDKTKESDTLAGLTVREAIEKDSNNNGIADWEEKLWGLNPTIAVTDGVSNKTIIEGRRKQLESKENNLEPITSTDELSRGLFALTAALEEKNADTEALKAIAEEIGTEVTIDGFKNRYRLSDIKTTKTTRQSLLQYYSASSNIYKKHPEIGSELPVIATVSDTGIIENPDGLTAIANSYTMLAKELSAISAPVGVAQYHLSIINSLDHIASSIKLILLLERDGLQAMIGGSFYGSYTIALEDSANRLRQYLADYSILGE